MPTNQDGNQINKQVTHWDSPEQKAAYDREQAEALKLGKAVLAGQREAQAQEALVSDEEESD